MPKQLSRATGRPVQHRRIVFLLALTAAVSLCTADFLPNYGQALAQGKAEITIDNFTFAPAELTVSAGATVTWINHDDIPHLVVDKNKLYRSPALDTDDSYSFTFTQPGSYDYFCGLHPHMTGKIVVKP
jgi:amicyanin